MRKVSVSITMTVYHDGQFWVGIVERLEDGGLSVARIVFGAEPSVEAIQDFVTAKWSQLRFTQPVIHEQPSIATNPKRRQRDAAREVRQRGSSTKAQAALSEQREAQTKERRDEAKEKREQMKQMRWEQRRQKSKRKHRGK